MTVYVFALGINTYRDPITSLKCCEHDARSVVALFKEGFGYQAEYLEERKAEDIIDRFKALRSKVQSGDTFVFYFSGHGKAHKNDQYLLLPGADLDVLDDHSAMGIGVLSYTMLKRLTSGPGWQGVHRVFILDACRSALMADKAGDAAVCDSEFLIRDMAISKSAKLPVDQAFTVINSCAVGATASEIPSTKHGLFTSSLLAGLRKAKESSQHALIDEEFVQSIGSDMAAAAVAHGMPQVLRHQPVFGGQPVTLKPAASTRHPDEDLEWDMCQAAPTAERLERFIRAFPQSQRRAAALSMLESLHSVDPAMPKPPPKVANTKAGIQGPIAQKVRLLVSRRNSKYFVVLLTLAVSGFISLYIFLTYRVDSISEVINVRELKTKDERAWTEAYVMTPGQGISVFLKPKDEKIFLLGQKIKDGN